MAQNNDEMKNSDSYLNNFATAVNELFGLSKKEEMGSAAAMASEIQEPNEVRSQGDFRPPRSKSNLHVLPQDHSRARKETVIEENTVIRGEVLSTSNMDIAGAVKGPVSSEGDILVTGKIYGNIKGNNITIKGGLVEGNIVAKSDISLLGEAIVVGDIEANNFVSEGKIKGNVKALNAISLKNRAVMYGNINAKTVNMQDGVILDGNIKIVGDVSIENLFQDLSVKKAEVITVQEEE